MHVGEAGVYRSFSFFVALSLDRKLAAPILYTSEQPDQYCILMITLHRDLTVSDFEHHLARLKSGGTTGRRSVFDAAFL